MKYRRIVISASTTIVVVCGVWLSARLPAAQRSATMAATGQGTQQPMGQATAAATTTPTVGALTATPSIITVSTSTIVTFTVRITDSSLLPGGVNLLRLATTGTQSTILGVMHDDGLNGDSVAGDHVYTLQVPFNETTAGQIQLQVSAAFKGVLKRVLSTTFAVNVWTVLSDPTTHLSMNYPAGWSAKSYENTYTISSTSTPPTLETDPGNEVQISVLPSHDLPTIISWLKDYYSGEVDFSTHPVTYYTNPYGITFAIVTSMPSMSSDNIDAYTLQGNTVLQLSVSPASTFNSLFVSMLSSFRPF